MVYGRQPVLEALRDPVVVVDEVLLARRGGGGGSGGGPLAEVAALAESQGVPFRWVAPEKVGRVSGDPRNDQGVVAYVIMASVPALAADLLPVSPVLVLDGITNPGNVGMILRSAVAFGVGGVVLPRAGVPDVGPLVVKASSGVALHAPVFSCATAAEGVSVLREGGFRVLGLAAGAAASLWSVGLPERVAFVLGNETSGLSVDVDQLVSIPMAGGVESLNVAVAAGVLCAELARRSLSSR